MDAVRHFFDWPHEITAADVIVQSTPADSQFLCILKKVADSFFVGRKIFDELALQGFRRSGQQVIKTCTVGPADARERLAMRRVVSKSFEQAAHKSAGMTLVQPLNRGVKNKTVALEAAQVAARLLLCFKNGDGQSGL